MTRLGWLSWRRGGIGSSDAPALVGLDPRKGPLAVYLDKVGLLPLDDGDVDEAQHWGRILEESIADEFEKRTGLYAVDRQRSIVHQQYPFLRATLDAFVDEQPDTYGEDFSPLGTLELKTASRRSSDWKSDDGSFRIPDHVQIQVQHQLAVSGLPVAWVAVRLMFPVPKMEIAQVQRDDAAIATLLEIESAFWQRVERREPPPADSFPATTDALRDAFPSGKEVQSVELDDLGLSWLARYRVAARELKTFEDRKTLAENELKLRIGEKTAAVYGGRIVATWSSSTSERVDTKAVKTYIEKHPRSPVSKFITTSTTRRFSVKAKLVTEEDEDDD